MRWRYRYGHTEQQISTASHDDTERQSKCAGIPHLTCTSDTHVSFGVDVGFGFDKCDGDIGMATPSSKYQRRLIKLRTHDDTERQSKCAGIPHLTYTSDTHVSFGVDVGFGFDKCDGDIGVAIMSSHRQRREITLRTHDDTER